MTERVSHYKNTELFHQRIQELSKEFYPGDPRPIDFLDYHGGSHGRYADRAYERCNCVACEGHRGRMTREERDVYFEIWSKRFHALDKEYRTEPPVPDSPELWAAWPAAEET